MDDPCDEVLAEIERYLDGECTAEAAAVVRAHLHDCSPCMDRADFQRRVRALVAQRCRESAPPELVARIRASLE